MTTTVDRRTSANDIATAETERLAVRAAIRLQEEQGEAARKQIRLYDTTATSIKKEIDALADELEAKCRPLRDEFESRQQSGDDDARCGELLREIAVLTA